MTIALGPYLNLASQRSWEHFCSRIRACDRKQRLRVIALLDTAVEEEFISQLTADAILREWDVLCFPEQMPLPLRQHITRLQQERRSILIHKILPDDEEAGDVTEEMEEPCAPNDAE